MIKTIPQAIDDMAVSLGASPSAEIPTVAQALENLYTALGGTRTDLDTLVVSEVIDLVAPLIQGGGGGSTVPIFTNNNAVYSCDMTYAEVYSAYQADNLDGKAVCKVRTILEGVSDTTAWGFSYYVPHGEEIDELFDSVPNTVQNGFVVLKDGAEGPSVYFGDDGVFYVRK